MKEDEQLPSFSSVQEELEFWRKKAQDRKVELEDLEADYQEIRDSSVTLEEEMERELKLANKKLDEMTRAYSLLKARSEETALKNRQGTQETLSLVEKLQAELESSKKMQADLLAKKRQLEQDNDDMQRREREALASVADLTEKLDKCFEENAWLQSELEERDDANREVIQRLRDEISEQKSELAMRQLQIQRLTEQLEQRPEAELFEGSPSSLDHLSASLPSLPAYSKPPPSPYSPALATTTPPAIHPLVSPRGSQFSHGTGRPHSLPAPLLFSSPGRTHSPPPTPPSSPRSDATAVLSTPLTSPLSPLLLPASNHKHAPDGSPLDMVNDMLRIVKELETRLSSQRAALASPLKKVNSSSNIGSPSTPSTFLSPASNGSAAEHPYHPAINNNIGNRKGKEKGDEGEDGFGVVAIGQET